MIWLKLLSFAWVRDINVEYRGFVGAASASFAFISIFRSEASMRLGSLGWAGPCRVKHSRGSDLGGIHLARSSKKQSGQQPFLLDRRTGVAT